MLKKPFFIAVVLLAYLAVNCHKETSVEPFNYDRDTPLWLKGKISVMSSDTTHYFALTKVYRYDWNSSFVYHISIPASSCAYCELYDQNGNKLTLSEGAMQDFLNNRKGEVLIWENK